MRRLLAWAAALVIVVGAASPLALATPAHADGVNVGAAIAFARAQVGKPYVLGANGPNSWDCSSLVQHAYAAAGLALPRVTTEQIGAAGWVPLSQIQPGDLVFRSGSEAEKPGHVGLYAGGGQVIEAKGSAWGTVVTPLSVWHPLAVIRPGAPGVNGFIDQAAARTGVPRDLLRAQIWQESGFNPTIGSPAGAQGIGQFMPTTWNDGHGGGRGVDGNGDGKRNILDPADAIPAMADMDADLIRANNGDIGMALAAYNAGQGAVNKFHGIPPYTETQNYVTNILASADLKPGRIDLHPTAPPAPPIATLVREAAIAALPTPVLPTSVVDWVGDLTWALLTIAAGLTLLRWLAPHLYTAWKARAQKATRRMYATVRTRPRPQRSTPTARWIAREYTARATVAAERGAVKGAAIRDGRAYRHTRLAVTTRRAQPTPHRSGRAPHRPPLTRHTTPGSTQGRPVILAVLSGLRSGLGWLATLRRPPNTTPLPNTTQPGSTPHAGRPHAYAPPPNTTPTPPADTTPLVGVVEARPHRPDWTPHTRSRPMDLPTPLYNAKWREHLTNPSFEAGLQTRHAITSLELDYTHEVVAVAEYLMELCSGLSEALTVYHDEVHVRDYDESIVVDIAAAAEDLNRAANNLFAAHKAFPEKHPDYFKVKGARGIERIGA